jgi:hypothetical protein
LSVLPITVSIVFCGGYIRRALPAAHRCIVLGATGLPFEESERENLSSHDCCDLPPLSSLYRVDVYGRVRTRDVLDRILRLTPVEVNQLEKALDSEPEVVPQLRAFLQRISEARETVSK